MHLWCFLFFCFLISRINKLHFLDTGCENAKLWFQFKGCVIASRHNSAARIRTLALCSHILMSGRLLSCSPLTLVPHEDSAAEINLPDVGVEGEVPLRGLVVREPPIDLHQLHIVTVWNTWNIWKKTAHSTHSPLTYSWTAWTGRCGCRAGSGRTPCRGRPPSRRS